MNSSNAMEIDSHLSQLLESMTLGNRWANLNIENEERHPSNPHQANAQDMYMSDASDSGDSAYQSNPSASTSSNVNAQPCGCVYLQAIRGQLHSSQYPTTGGDYLDTIFTHREVFSAYPQGHRGCAIAFSDMASLLEAREWRADRDADSEAVAAFRNEALVIANAWC